MVHTKMSIHGDVWNSFSYLLVLTIFITVIDMCFVLVYEKKTIGKNPHINEKKFRKNVSEAV